MAENLKYKIVALVGKSGCGKDTCLQQICLKYPKIFNRIIASTTRPQRYNETNGQDYYFLSNLDFTREVLNGNMLEATEFNDWFYGTSINALSRDMVNVGIFSPAAIEALIDNPVIDLVIVYIDAPDKQRLMRALQREKNPNCHEICRRFLADENDFFDLDFAPQIFLINDDTTSIDSIGERLYHAIEKYGSMGDKINMGQ